MQARSIRENSAKEIKNTLQQSLAPGFKPTLATFFIPKCKPIPPSLNYCMMQVAIFGTITNGGGMDEETGMGYFSIMADEFCTGEE